MSASSIPAAVDIMIVGGGPTAASLALLLAAQRQEWRIMLLTHAPPAARSDGKLPMDHRATALSVSSQRIFSSIGIWDAIAAQAAPIEEIHVSERGWFGAAQLKAREDHFPAYGHVVENARLMGVLMDAIAQQQHIIATHVGTVDIEAQTAAGVVLRVDGRLVTARLLVAADGAQSRLRGQLGIGVESKAYGKNAVAAVLSLTEPHRGVAYERFTPQGPIALLPLPDSDNIHRAALVWSLSPQQAEHLLTLPAARFLADLQCAFGTRAGQFSGVGERQCFPLKRLIAAEQVRRNLVLMGNAAHNLHPVAGQGFNLTLRDCAALSATLTDGVGHGAALGDLELLENYVHRQAWDQRRTMFFSDRLPALFGSPAQGLALARNMGLVGLDLCPTLRGKIARLGAGIDSREAQSIDR